MRQHEIIFRLGLFAFSGFVLFFTGIYLMSNQQRTPQNAAQTPVTNLTAPPITEPSQATLVAPDAPADTGPITQSVPPVADTDPTAQPSATSGPDRYTVANGDTMWSIAVKFNLSLQEMIAANPSVDPDHLKPGDGLIIPAPGTVDTSKVTVQPLIVPSATPSNKARVASNADGLRLRQSPSTSGRIIARLTALTPLTIVDKSADGAWLQVVLANGTRGWVMSRYVETGQ